MVRTKKELTLNYNKAIFLFKKYPWPDGDMVKFVDYFREL